MTLNSSAGRPLRAEINIDNSPGARLARIWLRLVRLYTYNTPIDKGKYRIYLTALRLCPGSPGAVKVGVKDGRRLWANFDTGMTDSVFFLGEYEKSITRIATALIKEGDVCIDVGANFGWYTTLMSRLAGHAGCVHSFEPVPGSFFELKRNCELLEDHPKVFINNLALGDKQGIVSINVFENEPTGHASLASYNTDGSTAFECKMITLDSYLEEQGIENVDFVKIDVEGAELMFLKGSGNLFQQAVPPVILMEMALAQTTRFGHTPNELVEFIRGHADYEFFSVDEIRGMLRAIDGFHPDDPGANVFCIPRGLYTERLSSFLSD